MYVGCVCVGVCVWGVHMCVGWVWVVCVYVCGVCICVWGVGGCVRV